jgi:N2-acetyl-L-2,4-diaminobutanoate deacetylase
MNIEEFSAESVPAGTIQPFFLQISRPDDGRISGIPVLVAQGSQTGKTVVIFAGVHGDELEGVQALQEVFLELSAEALSGRIVAVMVANLAAFRVTTRTSPIDGLNLARIFPGRKDGTLSERVAHYLSQFIIQADFFIDLHSSGLTYVLPMMIGYDASDTRQGRESREAALCFGTPVMWGHKEISPGRSLCVAIEKEIPWLYVECPSGGRVSASALPYYVEGVRGLLKHLDMLPGSVARKLPEVHLIGTGDLDRTIAVNTDGFFVPRVSILGEVVPNQVVGVVRDLFGQTIEEVRTEHGGLVGMLRAIPVVHPGDSVCLVVDKGPDLGDSQLRHSA